MPATINTMKRAVYDLRNIEVSAGQKLRVKVIGMDGDPVLDVECPDGEAWTVTAHIEVNITDA